jgi:WD40 repeat protein
MKLWRLDPDGSSATCVATLNEGNGGHINRVSSVAFHQTLPLFATGSWDTTTKIWRLDKPDGSVATCVATLDNRSVTSVAFHPTLPLLAVCSDDSINLWNLLDRSGRVQIARVSNTLQRWQTRYYA